MRKTKCQQCTVFHMSVYILVLAMCINSAISFAGNNSLYQNRQELLPYSESRREGSLYDIVFSHNAPTANHRQDFQGIDALGGSFNSNSDTNNKNETDPSNPNGVEDSLLLPVEDPLDFSHKVAIDFQPGRLLNIFFGLFILLFMMIFQGYAMWVMGISFLPGGGRSLSIWSIPSLFTVLKAIGYFLYEILDAWEYWNDN